MAVVEVMEVDTINIWWEARVAPLSGEFRDHLNETRKTGTDYVFPDVGTMVKPDDVE